MSILTVVLIFLLLSRAFLRLTRKLHEGEPTAKNFEKGGVRVNTKKPSKYTDEDILTMNKVTAKIAANYLGGRWTYEMLTWMLRQDAEKGTGKAPFGKAVHRKNWSY